MSRLVTVIHLSVIDGGCDPLSLVTEPERGVTHQWLTDRDEVRDVTCPLCVEVVVQSIKDGIREEQDARRAARTRFDHDNGRHGGCVSSECWLAWAGVLVTDQNYGMTAV